MPTEAVSNYPTTDPHPVGSLTSGDEEIVEETLATITQFHAALNPSLFTSAVKVRNGHAYFIYCDENRRPKFVKVNLTTKAVTTAFLDPGADYQALADDPHNIFVFDFDRDGYIHVSGDMHNHRSTGSGSAAMIERYQNSDMMYWVSDSPESISGGFSFYGFGEARMPDAVVWSYQRFFTDNDGKLFLSARVYTYDGDHEEGEVGLGLYVYDESTTTWTAYGAIPTVPHTETATEKVMFWAPTGQYHKTTPGNPDDAFYQSMYGFMRFDKDNTLQVCYPINNDSDNYNDTEVVYFEIRDGEDFPRKADGTVLAFPVGATGSANEGDIVHVGRVQGYCSVGRDWNGNAIVSFNKYSPEDQNPGTGTKVEPDTKIFRDGEWESSIDMPIGGYGSKIDEDSNHILTYISDSKANGLIYRTRRYGETGYTFAMGTGIALEDYDRKYYRETDRIIGLAVSSGEITLKAYSFNVGALPVTVSSVSRRMILAI